MSTYNSRARPLFGCLPLLLIDHHPHHNLLYILLEWLRTLPHQLSLIKCYSLRLIHGYFAVLKSALLDDSLWFYYALEKGCLNGLQLRMLLFLFPKLVTLYVGNIALMRAF